MIGRIVKAVSGVFTVERDGAITECRGRGKMRKDAGGICVGDMVEYLPQEGIVEKVCPRRNFLVRPPVANVDQVIIVVAPAPEPDWILVDKICLNAVREGVKAILCVNKSDLTDDAFCRAVFRQYASVAEKIFTLSAKTGEGMEELRGALAGKISCLAGQSAVGKSSLANALLEGVVVAVGGLSERSGRGKHTTRHSEILALPRGGCIVDTPGFTFVDFFASRENGDPDGVVDPALIKEYYPDFLGFASACKYRDCLHRREPGCEVKRAVEAGELAAERYERYLAIYEEYSGKWKSRF